MWARPVRLKVSDYDVVLTSVCVAWGRVLHKFTTRVCGRASLMLNGLGNWDCYVLTLEPSMTD